MSIAGRLVRAAAATPWRGEPCETLLYAADVDRGSRVDGRWFAQILDSYWLLHGGGEEAMTLAPIGSRLTGAQAFGRVIAPSFSETLGDLAAALRGGIARQEQARAHYRRLIKGSGCRRVIGIQPPDALVEAGRDLGIPVFDLQHGVIGPRNGYYERLGRGGSWLRFLVWDEVARATLVEEIDVAPDRIEVVGHPWLDLFLKPPPEFRAPILADHERAQASLKSADGKPVILVTLQWGMDELHPSDFDNPCLPRGLADAVAKSPGTLWWIRPHPMHAEARPLTGSNVRWCDAREISLPAALALADGHVTWDSSAVIEAVLSGIPSLVLSGTGHAERDSAGRVVRPDRNAAPAFGRYRGTGLVSWAGGDSRVADLAKFARSLKRRS